MAAHPVCRRPGGSHVPPAGTGGRWGGSHSPNTVQPHPERPVLDRTLLPTRGSAGAPSPGTPRGLRIRRAWGCAAEDGATLRSPAQAPGNAAPFWSRQRPGTGHATGAWRPDRARYRGCSGAWRPGGAQYWSCSEGVGPDRAQYRGCSGAAEPGGPVGPSTGAALRVWGLLGPTGPGTGAAQGPGGPVGLSTGAAPGRQGRLGPAPRAAARPGRLRLPWRRRPCGIPGRGCSRGRCPPSPGPARPGGPTWALSWLRLCMSPLTASGTGSRVKLSSPMAAAAAPPAPPGPGAGACLSLSIGGRTFRAAAGGGRLRAPGPAPPALRPLPPGPAMPHPGVAPCPPWRWGNPSLAPGEWPAGRVASRPARPVARRGARGSAAGPKGPAWPPAPAIGRIGQLLLVVRFGTASCFPPPNRWAEPPD